MHAACNLPASLTAPKCARRDVRCAASKQERRNWNKALKTNLVAQEEARLAACNETELLRRFSLLGEGLTALILQAVGMIWCSAHTP